MESRAESGTEKELPIGEIEDFPDYPFQVREDADMEQFFSIMSHRDER